MQGSKTQEVVMKKLSNTEVSVDGPTDVVAAIDWCEDHGAVETVFFVAGFPVAAGRCQYGTRPASFIARMKMIVGMQSDLHARVGECIT